MQRCTPQLYIWDITIAQSYQFQRSKYEANTIPNSKYRDVVARFIPRMVPLSHFTVKEVTDLASGSS